NDGLNMVVPHGQDAYFRLRPSISLAPGGLHRLGDGVGLHQRMGGCAELFAEGDLAVVQGVGYPDPDRSHFRSMQVWHTADPRTAFGAGVVRPEAGWLGKLAAQVAREGGGMPALHLGTGDLPLSLKTRAGFTPTVRDARGFRLEEPAPGFAAARDRLLGPGGVGTGREANLATLRAAARSTYDAAARMQDLVRSGGRSSYPGHALAERLSLCAQLIAGGFGTRIFGLELGGFDTHARQGPSHAALLAELSESLTAFQRDLEAKGIADRVVTLVFSEFGRRVEENASKGTDHGAAGPALVVGRPLRGGLLGATPDLGELEAGDLPFGVDFRSLYTSLERDWLGLEASTPVPALGGLL
ncbi:MAG: DUF1501 domain-containing protein, partial [Planctomycetota bacterium]|nr:DUF1501 domain-containing protein [Planctomycetota bacterium]